MLNRRAFLDREAWLRGRQEFPGIGASEAAAIVGLSPWSDPIRLWREKTGRDPLRDLAGNAAVRFGTAAEEPLRALFMLQHPELSLSYHAYDFLYQEERPWLRCTLDGELTEIATGEMGILEIKTAELPTKADWETWNGKIPEHYLCQVLHQFQATGFLFAYLYAMLLAMDGSAVLRSYYFRREDYTKDMAWLLGREEKFWNHVTEDKMPGTILRI